MAKRRKQPKHTFISRFGDLLAVRDGGLFCHYCRIPLKRLKLSKPHKVAFYASIGYGVATIDHVIPLCKGGSRSSDNMVLACSVCNERKGESSYTSFMRMLEYEQYLKTQNRQNQLFAQRG